VISIVILTKDEERNLPFALESLRGLAAKIFVVDSGSTDRTLGIAQEFGCTIVSHPFTTHARQVNWAIETLPIDTDWVMRLDADERLTPELRVELQKTLPALPPEVTGLMLKRRVYFWGRWIRHGGYYPIWLLRVWRRGAAICEDRDMDEHMLLLHGRIGRLQNDIIDENRKDISFWIEKHNLYASKEAASARRTSEAETQKMGGPISRRRHLKGIYERSPRFLRALCYWIFRYVFLLGFLDGRAGFVFHFLQAFWYRLLVDAKLAEADAAEGRPPTSA